MKLCRPFDRRTLTQNTFIVRSLTAQRVRLRSMGLRMPACIDQYRIYGTLQSTGQRRYGNLIQLYRNCTTAQ